jgi:nucleotide-binding universal stress UspA family protein
MKDVLAHVTPIAGDSLGAGASYALALARAHGAHLSALIAEIEPEGIQGNHVIGQSLSLAERLARTAERLRSAANLANVPCEILAPEVQYLSLRERLIDCAQVRDLLVLDVYGPLQSPRRDLVDGTLFGSGRPVILVPQGAPPSVEDRILIAWDATRAAVRAVRDALPLLVRARDVIIASVIDDKTFSTPHSGNALCRYLARWNVSARFEIVKRESLNVGVTLLTHARRAEVGLLVMGGFAHGFERELMLGSATRDIFQASFEIPVLLSH